MVTLCGNILQDVIKSAAKVLANKFFGGEPKVVSLDQNTSLESERGLINLYETGNGSAVQCSAAFYGLKLYVLRMIEPIWRDNLFKGSSNGKLVQCNWSIKVIEVIQVAYAILVPRHLLGGMNRNKVCCSPSNAIKIFIFNSLSCSIN